MGYFLLRAAAVLVGIVVVVPWLIAASVRYVDWVSKVAYHE
jgi:hypothetical protein